MVSADTQADIAGQSYTLRFSVKALAAMQDHWQLPNLDAVGQKLGTLESGDASLEDYTAILWAALRTHHADVTKEQAFDLLDDMGIEGFLSVISDCVGASAVEGGGEASGNPPRRGRSAGSSRSAAK